MTSNSLNAEEERSLLTTNFKTEDHLVTALYTTSCLQISLTTRKTSCFLGLVAYLVFVVWRVYSYEVKLFPWLASLSIGFSAIHPR
jgi:hypothetical protein